MPADAQVIAHTRAWVEKVIIGCNFCPFARREVERGSVRYEVVRAATLERCLLELVQECIRLDDDAAIETTLLIYPAMFSDFEQFLEFLYLAEELLPEQGYEGVYQLASFHPDYCFADTEVDDPANYTNRSPYPVLHLIREASMEKALNSYPNPERIPERNIEYARRLGRAKMEQMLAQCLTSNGVGPK